MTESLLPLTAVKVRTALSRSEIYRRMAEGRFPQPVRLSKRLVAWPDSEITAWVDQQVTQRDSQKQEIIQ